MDRAPLDSFRSVAAVRSVADLDAAGQLPLFVAPLVRAIRKMENISYFGMTLELVQSQTDMQTNGQTMSQNFDIVPL